MTPAAPIGQSLPILLFNDECSVCRHLGHWVRASAGPAASARLVVQPIGADPAALRRVNADLDIWDAYEVLHVVMPDGTMKLGGEAVAEVLRRLPRTRWFTWLFALTFLGFRPFQEVLNAGYNVLADVRPLLGCESCGSPVGLMRPLAWSAKRLRGLRGKPHAAAMRSSKIRTPQ